jgi:prepilin signal peptidase PulO-like enzyme (type II secretory pathway)
MTLLLLFVLGAITGSFLGSLTWRWPKNISIFDGRSRCPKCKHVISWHDNIPIISFLVLRGKCRHCHKKISIRYPIIEFAIAILFPITYFLLPKINMNLTWLLDLGMVPSLLVVLTLVATLVAIFVIDFEDQYIPDSLVFLVLMLTLGIFLATSNNSLFQALAAGGGAGVFLLILHLVTLGRGMGLGDVKLAFALGTILGFPLSVVFMFAAFILGSATGLVLIALKLAKARQKIAFGPFLIAGFVLTCLFGFDIINTFFKFI